MAKKEDANLRLGEVLLKWDVIDKDALNRALEIQKTTKKKLGEILIDNGFTTDQKITEALAYTYHLPIVDLSEAKIDEKLLRLFPVHLLKNHRILPLEIKNNSVVVATNDPLDIAVIQDLRHISGYRIKTVMANLHDIETELYKRFGPLRSAEEAIQEIVGEEEEHIETPATSLRELEMAAQEAPIIKLVSSVIKEAIKQRASDIHFEPQRKKMRIRFRIDGVLYEKMSVPKTLQPAVVSRIKIISGMDIAERRKPQDGRMDISEGRKEFDIRVSTLPDIFGEKAVLRLLDKTSIVRPLETLGLDKEGLKIIKSLIYQPYGMILLTGPTGSGKTTTLYSILNLINDASRNIVTVEDPVEYELDGINQTHINVRAGYTFATAIRHILRQDPDVIMIGEIRDLETAEIAIQAALTGHLVLSTLHTNNAPGAIARLLDMNVEPFLITSAVIGVIAQRLVRQLCPVCKINHPVPAELKEKIAAQVPLTEDTVVAQPKGCEKCYKIGYSGRTGIFEIFTMDDSIRNLVLKKATETEIMNAAIAKGMKTLQVSGINKALNKVTSLEEVVRVTFLEKV